MTRELKERGQAQVNYLLQSLLARFTPLSFLRQTLLDMFSRHSFVFSNLPGPAMPVKFGQYLVDEFQVLYPNLLPQVGRFVVLCRQESYPLMQE